MQNTEHHAELATGGAGRGPHRLYFANPPALSQNGRHNVIVQTVVVSSIIGVKPRPVAVPLDPAHKVHAFSKVMEPLTWGHITRTTHQLALALIHDAMVGYAVKPGIAARTREEIAVGASELFMLRLLALTHPDSPFVISQSIVLGMVGAIVQELWGPAGTLSALANGAANPPPANDQA